MEDGIVKKTKWFSSFIRPVRVGVYQRLYNNGVIAYCWWDNGWSMGWQCAETAKQNRHIKSEQYGLLWRGLTQEPKP